MGEIPDIPSKMMVSTLLLLTFLSMAVGAPQLPTSRQLELEEQGPIENEKYQVHYGVVDSSKEASYKGAAGKGYKERTAPSPPPEDLLDQYIFTTYHLLLKEIRNEAGDTEIVAQRVRPAGDVAEQPDADLAPFEVPGVRNKE